MKMTNYTISILFVLLSFSLFSQSPDIIWYFGNNTGIDFNTNPPTYVSNTAMSAADNTSTISDCNGDLLFYTNGVDVYNKNDNLMQNGSNLGAHISAGQSALIVPQPNSSLYYVFTVGFASQSSFNYAVVDMSLNASLGAVTTKGNVLFNNTTEKLDAIYNPADTSYWILTHKWNSNQYYCYKLDKNGLNTTPIISSIGSTHSGGYNPGYNAMGQMTFSPDGSKVVSAIYSDGVIETFDFNMTTGQLSNLLSMSGFTKSWGIAISSNNQFLYYTEWYNDKIWQFDISSNNVSTILSTKTVIGTVTCQTPGSSYKVGYLQTGPDGRIYAAKYGQHYISSIQNPNLQGTSCNFIDNAISLGNNTCAAGLSRTISEAFYMHMMDSSITEFDTICKNADYIFRTNSGIHKWYSDSLFNNFLGSDSVFHLLNVTHDTILYSKRDLGGCSTFTIKHQISLLDWRSDFSLGNDKSICDGDSIVIDLSSINGNKFLNSSPTQAIVSLYASGSYIIEIDSAGCWLSDSIQISLIESPIKHVLQETTLCDGFSQMLSAQSNMIYLWNNGATAQNITVSDSGMYWVDISNQCDTVRDTIIVHLKDCSCIVIIPNAFSPNGDLINDEFKPFSICEFESYELTIFNRWGEVVYKSYNQHESWDGTFKGKSASIGNYVYILIYKPKYNEEKKKLTGNLYLIR